MKLKEHTRNQKRMYRIHKQEEKIQNLELLVGKLQQENKQLKDKLSKIETLIMNHNCDTGDIYYKYNSRFLKSELKQRILEIVNGVSE